MSATERAGQSRIGVRVAVHGVGEANVATGLPVLDRLLTLLAEYASFDLALELATSPSVTELAAAGRALGDGIAGPLRAEGTRGHGAAVVPTHEALAHVALAVSDRAAIHSNVDLSRHHVGGIGTDVVAAFLRELASGAGLTLHVRLIEGTETQHVLEAIFKALGVALGDACGPRMNRAR
jgi:imidazoleglycerol-phosphate dehydratase